MTALVLGSATILGLFITLAAWLNGRSTKKVIKEVSQQTQEFDQGRKSFDPRADRQDLRAD